MSIHNNNMMAADADEAWITEVVPKLVRVAALAPDDGRIIERYVWHHHGVVLKDMPGGPGLAAARRKTLGAVSRAVAGNTVAALAEGIPGPRMQPVMPPLVAEVPPAGRVNPLTLAPRPEVNGNGPDDERAAALMLEAFKNLTRKAGPVALDEPRVKELAGEVADEKFAARIAAAVNEMGALLEQAYEAALAKAKPGGATHRIEIAHAEGKVVSLGEEPTHHQFEQVLTWLSANVPVWLWGKAGSGKTHLARQLAKALDLPAVVVSVDPTMTVGKLVGYRNLATGGFVEGFLYRPFKEGGLLMLDEIDTGDPGIIACLNALLANGHYLFPNGETLDRHPKFRVLAGANTKGTGAVAGYTARQRLDAATLNRFAVLELAYDERLEELLSLGVTEQPVKAWKRSNATGLAAGVCTRWVLWVRKVRQQVGESVLVSPRASYLGVAALRAGVPLTEVGEALVLALVTSDTKRSILSANPLI